MEEAQSGGFIDYGLLIKYIILVALGIFIGWRIF